MHRHGKVWCINHLTSREAHIRDDLTRSTSAEIAAQFGDQNRVGQGIQYHLMQSRAGG